MTWSILAHDPATGAFGVAVTTCAFAVGAFCPHLAPGKGALSTQATTNPLFGVDGVAYLAEGLSAEEALARLIAADPGRSRRQLHILDAGGGIAQHTGSDCVIWAGAARGPRVSVAGNMLVGPQVVQATLDRYVTTEGLPFAERLLDALDAGQAVGGDKRGKQSAAMKIALDQPYPLVDIRVDDHPDPLAELRRLYGVASLTHIPAYPYRARR
ncbi:MAG: DUF1028 domain-containing protein [Elsteraceae bacterium]